jgi:hypothetical protein
LFCVAPPMIRTLSFFTQSGDHPILSNIDSLVSASGFLGPASVCIKYNFQDPSSLVLTVHGRKLYFIHTRSMSSWCFGT